jgi:hypothetical protein
LSDAAVCFGNSNPSKNNNQNHHPQPRNRKPKTKTKAELVMGASADAMAALRGAEGDAGPRYLGALKAAKWRDWVLTLQVRARGGVCCVCFCVFLGGRGARCGAFV